MSLLAKQQWPALTANKDGHARCAVVAPVRFVVNISCARILLWPFSL